MISDLPSTGLLGTFLKMLSSKGSDRSVSSTTSSQPSSSREQFHTITPKGRDTASFSPRNPHPRSIHLHQSPTEGMQSSSRQHKFQHGLLAVDEVRQKNIRSSAGTGSPREKSKKRHDSSNHSASRFPPEDPESEDQEDYNNAAPLTIEVKPLPKIRLSLMPAPREEDEENSSSVSGSPERSKSIRKKRNSSEKKRPKKSSMRSAPRDDGSL